MLALTWNNYDRSNFYNSERLENNNTGRGGGGYRWRNTKN